MGGSSSKPSEASQLLWKEHGVVLLPRFHDQYRPLAVLKLNKRKKLGQPPVLKVWSNECLAAFKDVDSSSFPRVQAMEVQTINSSSDSSSNLRIAAHLGSLLTADASWSTSKAAGYDLAFKSEVADSRELTRFINQHLPADDWGDLTRDSFGLWGATPSCALIQEVWYARRVKVRGQVYKMQHE